MPQNNWPVISECIIAFDLSLHQYNTIGTGIGLLAGYSNKQVPDQANFWYPVIHHADVEKVKAVHASQLIGQTTEVSYRITPVGSHSYRYITEKRSIYTDAITGHQMIWSLFNEQASQDSTPTGEELKRARANLESLINNTRDHIWSIDTALNYMYTNIAYKEAVLAETGKVPRRGKPLVVFGTNEQQSLWQNYYARALSGEHFDVVYEHLNAVNNQQQYYEVGFNPIYNTEGEVVGMGCFARDITQHLNHEKEIRNQNARLRNIASISSHELRRPVASLLGLINVIDFENFNNPENKETIGHLLTVGKEIDEVIRLIVESAFSGKVM
ncbi:hypothetical protein A0256_05285 [Mucilaginibacter sp. PAMC 26640]|nr:hypothetical protein A0256_05285 [Mucilaginibacter sp. PAMC 26640]